MTMIPLLVGFIVTLTVYYVLKLRKPSNYPPGPRWLPFVGNVPELKQLSKALGGQHLALSELAKRYKTNVLGLKLGDEYVVTVFSYPVLRDVLIREEFEGRPDNFFIRLRCMGKKRGVTCTDGELWQIQRNFVDRHLRRLGFGKKPMEVMIADEVSEMLDILRTDGSNINVNKFFAPAVLNILWTLATGSRVSRKDKQLNELLDLFSVRAKAFDMTGGLLTQYPWLRHLFPEWTGFNLIQDINRKLKEFFMRTIQEHQETWTEGRNDDVIYRYISEIREGNKCQEVFNDDELVMLCLDLFIAGTQTTSGTLDFAFLFMILYPDVQKKVQAEIDEQLSRDSVLAFSDRRNLPYVQAVILEVMRYRDVVPVAGPRKVMTDTYLDGHFLPKNTTVLLSFLSVNFDPDLWVEPEKFNPDRFLDDNGCLLPHDKIIPFGLGRRRCLGEILAKNCIFFFFVEILREFRVELADGTQMPTDKPLPGITLSPEKYWAKFTKRIPK